MSYWVEFTLVNFTAIGVICFCFFSVRGSAFGKIPGVNDFISSFSCAFWGCNEMGFTWWVRTAKTSCK